MFSKRFSVAALACLISAAFFAAPVEADPFAYTSDGTDLLVTDLSSGSSTVAGPLTGVSGLEALAWSPSRQLFGTDSNGDLFAIDETNGAATLIGNTLLGNIEGLDFLGPSLLAISFELTPTIYVLDTTDATPSFVITANSALPDSPRSMTVLDSENILVSCNPDFGATTSIYQINLSTGDVTLIGSPAVPFAAAALDFGTDGLLYLGSNQGGLYQISPTDASIINTITPSGFNGGLAMASFRPLVSAAAPEPTTLCLLALGTLALLAKRRR